MEIEKIVKTTVHETLTSLGFTIDDPTEVQKDMAHLRKTRNASDDVGKWVKRSAISICITGLATGIWIGLQTIFHLKD